MASLRLLLIGCCALAACHATAPLVNTHLPSVIEGEYLVMLKAGSVGLQSNTQVELLNSYHIGNFRALHVKVTNVQLAALRDDSNVELVEANANEFRALCNEQSSGASIWGLSRTSSRSLPTFVGATYQHLDEEAGEDVNAYIVDTGIYVGHNDYEGRAVHGFTAPGHVGEGDDDLNGHGTHCAGTVGGATYGVAKKVNLIAVKVLGRFGSGSTNDVVAGVNYVADSHSSGDKSVMNMSLGMSGTSPTLEAAVEAAIDAGVNAAVAAGNSNGNACNYSPARVEDALTTVASDNSDNLASFTNYGTCTDIVAPGVNVLSTYIGGPDATSSLSGTSMAAPHVAGWVARYLSSLNTVPTPLQVKAALARESTEDVLNIVPPKTDTPNLLMYRACDH